MKIEVHFHHNLNAKHLLVTLLTCKGKNPRWKNSLECIHELDIRKYKQLVPESKNSSFHKWNLKNNRLVVVVFDELL